MVDKTINNEFEQSLIDAGYNFFQDNWKNSIRGFQKKFTDDAGIKYFITGYHYNHSKQLNRPDIRDFDSYCFDVQFTLNQYTGTKQHQIINIEFSADFLSNEWRPITTLKEVENFYEKTCLDMKADYYELYN